MIDFRRLYVFGSGGLGSVVHRFPRVGDFLKLARLDRPIGIFLLFWPTLWALIVAAGGVPDFSNLLIFTLGVVLMRSAGCVINDYADREIDGFVKRTCNRPLVIRTVGRREALLFFVLLVTLAFVLVLFTNVMTVQTSVVGVALAVLYPFAKRYTHWPQVVLGLAFSWSIPMAFAAQTEALPPVVWLLFLTNFFWTVAYDTQYAMVDREDDLKAGIKSTAVLFGRWDNRIIAVFHCAMLACLLLLGHWLGLGAVYYLSLISALFMLLHQHRLTRKRVPEECFDAFMANHKVGGVIAVGLFFDQLF